MLLSPPLMDGSLNRASLTALRRRCSRVSSWCCCVWLGHVRTATARCMVPKFELLDRRCRRLTRQHADGTQPSRPPTPWPPSVQSSTSFNQCTRKGERSHGPAQLTERGRGPYTRDMSARKRAAAELTSRIRGPGLAHLRRVAKALPLHVFAETDEQRLHGGLHPMKLTIIRFELQLRRVAHR